MSDPNIKLIDIPSGKVLYFAETLEELLSKMGTNVLPEHSMLTARSINVSYGTILPFTSPPPLPDIIAPSSSLGEVFPTLDNGRIEQLLADHGIEWSFI